MGASEGSSPWPGGAGAPRRPWPRRCARGSAGGPSPNQRRGVEATWPGRRRLLLVAMPRTARSGVAGLGRGDDCSGSGGIGGRANAVFATPRPSVVLGCSNNSASSTPRRTDNRRVVLTGKRLAVIFVRKAGKGTPTATHGMRERPRYRAGGSRNGRFFSTEEDAWRAASRCRVGPCRIIRPAWERNKMCEPPRRPTGARRCGTGPPIRPQYSKCTRSPAMATGPRSALYAGWLTP